MTHPPALRRRTLLALASGLGLPGVASASRERDPIELIVPASAGTPADRWARAMAPFLERVWPRQPLVVRNRPGRGGLEALAELAAIGRERKVIATMTTPSLIARGIEAGETPLVERITPLAALIEEPVLLVTAPGGPTELEQLRNGTTAPIGAPPPGTGAHVTAMRLAERVGLPLLAFPSAAAARQAAAAGHVAAATLSLAEAIGFLRDNKLVALGVASTRRTPLLPDLPTLREAGLELLGATRRGFALPPGIPSEWRDRMAVGLNNLANDPDLATVAAENGQVPRYLGPEAWSTLLARQEDELRRRWQEDPWLPRRT